MCAILGSDAGNEPEAAFSEQPAPTPGPSSVTNGRALPNALSRMPLCLSGISRTPVKRLRHRPQADRALRRPFRLSS